MLSYYYSDNNIPPTINEFIPLTILQNTIEQKNILSIIKNSKYTIENCFSEYHPINNEFQIILTMLFGNCDYENNKKSLFKLLIYTLDKDYYTSVKDKWIDLISKDNYELKDKEHGIEFIQSDDQILFIHYKIIHYKNNDKIETDIKGNLFIKDEFLIHK